MNSYRKGANAERELARVLTDLFGCQVRRLASPFLPGFIAPDVYGLPGIHIEAKRRERVALPAALRQARNDAADAVPIVAHRSNHQPWLVTCELQDLPGLAAAVAKLPRPSTPSFVNFG